MAQRKITDRALAARLLKVTGGMASIDLQPRSADILFLGGVRNARTGDTERELGTQDMGEVTAQHRLDSKGNDAFVVTFKSTGDTAWVPGGVALKEGLLALSPDADGYLWDTEELGYDATKRKFLLPQTVEA